MLGRRRNPKMQTCKSFYIRWSCTRWSWLKSLWLYWFHFFETVQTALNVHLPTTYLLTSKALSTCTRVFWTHPNSLLGSWKCTFWKISRNSVVSVKAGQRLSFLETMMQTPTFVSVCSIIGNCEHRVCVNISEYSSLHMTESMTL